MKHRSRKVAPERNEKLEETTSEKQETMESEDDEHTDNFESDSDDYANTTILRETLKYFQMRDDASKIDKPANISQSVVSLDQIFCGLKRTAM